MSEWNWQGVTIMSRDQKLKGIATGATYRCRLEGCGGDRVSVKWPDGTHTYPCSKGIESVNGKWTIR